MEHIRNFLRGKGFVLALLACVAAAAAAGVWAVRTIRDQMAEDLGEKPSQSITGEETFPGADGGLAPDREEQVWQQDAAGAAQSVADLPESSSSGASSGAPSGSGSVSEPSELQTESPAASASAGSGYTRPVSGRVHAVWSGDELVYNETLADWRTHNGADYAADPGDEVTPVCAGKVTTVDQDALWGGVVEITAADGGVWRYCGLTDVKVKAGESITAADTLGAVGSIPAEAHVEPHIHLECLRDNAYQQPSIP